MNVVRTSPVIDAPVEAVWADLSDLRSHAEWMGDAVAVHVDPPGDAGVGSILTAESRYGPIRLSDRMEVTEWLPRVTIGVRHIGLVSGEGRFLLEGIDGGGTALIWEEHLRFPTVLGGPVGERIAAPILRSVFRANLRAFAARHA